MRTPRDLPEPKLPRLPVVLVASITLGVFLFWLVVFYVAFHFISKWW